MDGLGVSVDEGSYIFIGLIKGTSVFNVVGLLVFYTSNPGLISSSDHVILSAL